MSFIVNTFNDEELPVWPAARRQIPIAVTGKTTWTHSSLSPVSATTVAGSAAPATGQGQVLAPSPAQDAPDTAVSGNPPITGQVGPPVITAIGDRTTCATNTGNAAIGTSGLTGAPTLQSQLTLVQAQLTKVLSLEPATTMTITSLAPNNGPLTGGTSVVITGTGFGAASSQVTVTVQPSGKSVVGTVTTLNTAITFTMPAGQQPGPAGVMVQAATGTAAYKPNAYTYNAVPSAPTAVSPNTGSHLATTPVTIVGSGFTGATGVNFGANAATNFVLLSDGVITCTAPAQAAAGAQNVVVVDPAGNGTLTNGFTYT